LSGRRSAGIDGPFLIKSYMMQLLSTLLMLHILAYISEVQIVHLLIIV
jgi:hypothetical protein